MCSRRSSKKAEKDGERSYQKEKKKKRRRIKVQDDSSSSKVLSMCLLACSTVCFIYMLKWHWCFFRLSFLLQSAEEGEDDDGGEEDEKGTPKGRKKIRKILKDDKLRSETQNALKEEEERRKRIAEKERLREKLREVNRPGVQWRVIGSDGSVVKGFCIQNVWMKHTAVVELFNHTLSEFGCHVGSKVQ